MTGEIIAVGTEVLLGEIVNTNASYIAKHCTDIGLDIKYHSVVADDDANLRGIFETAVSRSDVVILCGGLGPTDDDMTRETVASVLGKKLVFDKDWGLRLTSYFNAWSKDKLGETVSDVMPDGTPYYRETKPMTPNNWKQAYRIEDGVFLDNPNGTAPGMFIDTESAAVILLPGPPIELKPMFVNEVIPKLCKNINEKRGSSVVDINLINTHSKILRVCGIGESALEESFRDIRNKYPELEISTYAKPGMVDIRVRIRKDAALCVDVFERVESANAELAERFFHHIYAYNPDITLPMAIISLLSDKGLKIAAAESCTGGLFMGELTGVPGASEVFTQGVVTYSNEAKMDMLGVSEETLARYGAVSVHTAYEMARGLRKFYGADVALSITGIAGPGGATAKKPVGLVYVCCIVGDKRYKLKLNVNGGREKVRDTAVNQSLILLWNALRGVSNGG